MKTFFLPLLIGCATGILSSWGIGGGTLLLLCMTLFLGVDQTLAQEINLLYFLPTALISLIWHKKGGYLDTKVLRSAIPAALILAAVCALAAVMVDVSLLRKPFGVFLLFAGASTLLQTRKK